MNLQEFGDLRNRKEIYNQNTISRAKKRKVNLPPKKQQLIVILFLTYITTNTIRNITRTIGVMEIIIFLNSSPLHVGFDGDTGRNQLH